MCRCVYSPSKFQLLVLPILPGQKSTKVPKPMEMYLTGGQVPRPIYLMRGGGGGGSSTQAHLPYREGGQEGGGGASIQAHVPFTVCQVPRPTYLTVRGEGVE